MQAAFTKTVSRLPQARIAVREAGQEVVELAAEAMKDKAVTMVETSSGSGRQYPELPNRSSAPYNVPVEQFGVLIDSIEVDRAPLGPGAIAADVFSEYPVVMEMEEGNSNMEPRPFMTEASLAGIEVLRTSDLVISKKVAL